MKQTKQDLYRLVEELNEVLGGEKYFLEVMNWEAYGPYRFRLSHSKTESMPLCTWDRMPCKEMYQYLRGALAAIGAYKVVNKIK